MLYLLQVNLGLVLFYALYKLVCTRDTFFRSRRVLRQGAKNLQGRAERDYRPD